MSLFVLVCESAAVVCREWPACAACVHTYTPTVFHHGGRTLGTQLIVTDMASGRTRFDHSSALLRLLGVAKPVGALIAKVALVQLLFVRPVGLDRRLVHAQELQGDVV